MPVVERIKSFKARQSDTETPLNEYETILSETDSTIWNLLRKEKDTIFEIEDWEIYRRAAELVKDIPRVETPSKPTWLPTARVDLSSLTLLQNGKVSEFNNLRIEGTIKSTDFVGADLHGAKLNKIDLHSAQLAESNFDGADLTQANLRGSDLKGASLNGANLSKADLSDASLNYASFRGAFLTDAIFNTSTMFTGTDFTNSTLTRVSFPHAFFFETKFTGANVEGANFQAALSLSKEAKSDLEKGGAIF